MFAISKSHSTLSETLLLPQLQMEQADRCFTLYSIWCYHIVYYMALADWVQLAELCEWSGVERELNTLSAARSKCPFGNLLVLESGFQQDLAPAHTAKSTKSWFNERGVTVLDWPANSSDLNPTKNLDERHQTRQCRWPEERYQSYLGFITPEQCHRLIDSMPRRIDAVIHAKGGSTKYWVHINEHTLPWTYIRSLTFLFKISFFIDLM